MIKQCVEKEEPYFVLRGQDRCALAAVEAYYEESDSVKELTFKDRTAGLREYP